MGTVRSVGSRASDLVGAYWTPEPMAARLLQHGAKPWLRKRRPRIGWKDRYALPCPTQKPGQHLK